MGVRTRGPDIKAGVAKFRADRAAREEAELLVDRWNRRVATGRDMLWSPTIRAALLAGTPFSIYSAGMRDEPGNRSAHDRPAPRHLRRHAGAWRRPRCDAGRMCTAKPCGLSTITGTPSTHSEFVWKGGRGAPEGSLPCSMECTTAKKKGLVATVVS